MKKLKKIHRSAPSRHQERQLLAWLNEWNISLELSAIDLDDKTAESWSDVNTKDVPLEKGQIRLLPPVSPALGSRPAYVAVLDADEDEGIRVAPYGRFAVPATPGELSTGRSCPAVRVLCLWNTRTLSAGVFESSWLVDEMTPGELSDAVAVLDSLKKGAELPEDLVSRTGPPLFHPADPRRIYINREQAFWDAVELQVGGRCKGACLTHLPWFKKESRWSELAIAAEERAVYAAAMRFSVEAADAVIVVSLDSDTGKCRFLVQTRGGEACAELDNYRIETPAGESCAIEQGRALLEASSLLDGFLLVDAANRPFALHPLNQNGE